MAPTAFNPAATGISSGCPASNAAPPTIFPKLSACPITRDALPRKFLVFCLEKVFKTHLTLAYREKPLYISKRKLFFVNDNLVKVGKYPLAVCIDIHKIVRFFIQKFLNIFKYILV